MKDAVSESRRQDAWERYMLTVRTLRDLEDSTWAVKRTGEKEQVDAVETLHRQAWKDARFAYAAYKATEVS